MLKKLLKYDTLSIIRYWWIIAVAVVATTGVEIACTNFYLDYFMSDDAIVSVMAAIAYLIASICNVIILGSISATTLMVYVRFYKNLFTDEGYLTFTLPVKRSELLASKTVHAFIWQTLHLLLIAVCKTVSYAATDNALYTSSIQWLSRAWENDGAWLILYGLLLLIMYVGIMLFSIALVYFCITLGAVIVKKAKLILSIAIYYVLNSIINSTVMTAFFVIIGVVVASYDAVFVTMTDLQVNIVIALALAVIAMIIFIFTALMYFITLSCLERRLNLS